MFCPRHSYIPCFTIFMLKKKKIKSYFYRTKTVKKKIRFLHIVFFVVVVFLEQNENKIPKADNSVKFMSKKQKDILYAILYASSMTQINKHK